MNTNRCFLWQYPSDSTDSDKLLKAVDTMRAAAEILETTGCDNIEVPLHVARVMLELLNSTAEAILDITLRAQSCTCQCKEE